MLSTPGIEPKPFSNPRTLLFCAGQREKSGNEPELAELDDAMGMYLSLHKLVTRVFAPEFSARRPCSYPKEACSQLSLERK